MKTLTLPCETGSVSDGFHTFDELYEHRCLLFLALGKVHGLWISRLHNDGGHLDGWFVAGMRLSGDDVTYHLPDKMWDLAISADAKILELAPKWDGHSSGDVIKRLKNFIRNG